MIKTIQYELTIEQAYDYELSLSEKQMNESLDSIKAIEANNRANGDFSIDRDLVFKKMAIKIEHGTHMLKKLNELIHQYGLVNND